MELISIIPDFQPRNDPALLEKAQALRPRLRYTAVPRPVSCRLNSSSIDTTFFLCTLFSVH